MDDDRPVELKDYWKKSHNKIRCTVNQKSKMYMQDFLSIPLG